MTDMTDTSRPHVGHVGHVDTSEREASPQETTVFLGGGPGCREGPATAPGTRGARFTERMVDGAKLASTGFARLLDALDTTTTSALAGVVDASA